MLRKLLTSFQSVLSPLDADVIFVVVENDTQANAKHLVLEHKKHFKVIYDWEPRLGIPLARNKCVEIAINQKATHIVFIDDDEWLPKDWLVKLWGYYLEQNPNTVVQGSVTPIFPPNTPEYFKPFFQPKEKPTGTQLHMCATNNVLVPIQLFTEYKLRFDESRPLAGGTDSKLFRQARALGIELIYTSEAQVYEDIPVERVSYKWISKRHFRIGLTIGEHKKLEGPTRWIQHCTTKVTNTSWRFIKSAFYLAKGNKSKHMKSWIKGCRSLGELLGPLGFKVDSYKEVQGN